MEGSVKDLSRYRFSCAKDNLEAAKVLLQVGQFKSSVNQSLNWLILVTGYGKKRIMRILP